MESSTDGTASHSDDGAGDTDRSHSDDTHGSDSTDGDSNGTDDGTDSADTGTSSSDDPTAPVECPPEPHCPHDAFPDVDEDGCPICTPTAGESEPCQEHMHCSPDLFCHQDECVPLEQLGCEDHADCFGGVCALNLCAPRCEMGDGQTWTCEDGRRCHQVITDDHEVGACVTPEQCADLGNRCGGILTRPDWQPVMSCTDGSEPRVPGWMSPMEGLCSIPFPPVPPCDYFGRMVDVVVLEVTDVGEHLETPPAGAECTPEEVPHLLVEGEVRASLLGELDGTISFRFPTRGTFHSMGGSDPDDTSGHAGWDPRLEWDEDHGLYWQLYRRSPEEVGPLCAGTHILVALAPSRDASLPGVLTADPGIALATPDADNWTISWPPRTSCFITTLPLLQAGATFADLEVRAAECEEDLNDPAVRQTLCP